MQIGDRYHWPDGTIIELTGVSRSGRFQTRFEYHNDDGWDTAVGDIGPADLSVLIRHNIVTVEEDSDD